MEVSAARDRDIRAAMQSADQVCHLLRRFIPDHCFRDAHHSLAEAFHQQGIELTSTLMRKEYEAWKSTQIDMLGLKP